MFYYFGRKGRAARTYPKPEYPIVIEPFAGSLAYSLHWRPAQAIGIERDTVVHDLWHRLCAMTVDELASFPGPELGSRTTDRWVIQSSSSNMNNVCKWRTVSPFMVEHFEQQRQAAIRNHDYANAHVLYGLGDWRQAPDIEATWFIDPPYQGVKQGYTHGADTIDFDELAEWVMTRRGQVIVCEGPAATWLPFEHHTTMQGPASHQQRNGKPNVEHVLTRTTHARCAQCSVTFPAARSDARYCSGRCRQAHLRAGRGPAAGQEALDGAYLTITRARNFFLSHMHVL